MLDIIEQIIADHFGVTHEELLTDKQRGASDARHFLWYVLHDVLGYSKSVISERYGVSTRNVLYYSSTVRDGIRNQPFYASNFKGIQKKLRLLDII
ncbi:MAG: hypothetical protein J6Y20_04600 [Lachnospiraceae bacterium]|nr:hypothetical protein [Kiritimatiellia bacterium]MBP5461385.1 hypothetical protein [Lachnospiraceae bacterium]